MKKRDFIIVIGVLAVICTAVILIYSAYQFRAVRFDVPANAILVIEPYKYGGIWVFDDSRIGLVREPFVAGVTEMMDKLVEDIPDAEEGFRLLFSASPFPGHGEKLVWRRAEGGGHWYYSERHDLEGWLCPAISRYFRKAPKEIYVKAEAKVDGGTLKMQAAYRFLLERLQDDGLNLIASENDEDLQLIEQVIVTNKMRLKVARYGDIEMGPSLCYYTKTAKELVAIVDVTGRGGDRYYVSYYLGPEGGASKEIKVEKRDGKWAVAADDGKWSVK